MAGEIGHVTVDPNGRKCGCGGTGHLEAYAGRAGIEAEVRRRVGQGADQLLADLAKEGPIKSRHLARGLEDEDPSTIELLGDAADALAQVLGNAATLLDIPLVVLGGGVVDKLGEPFLDQIRRSPAFGGFGADHVRLVGAHRLDDAGALGAALLAADRLGQDVQTGSSAPAEALVS
jgi:glucokinase